MTDDIEDPGVIVQTPPDPSEEGAPDVKTDPVDEPAAPETDGESETASGVEPNA